MKKIYQKPTMQVVNLHRHASLLAGSPYPYDGPIGYTPGSAPADDMTRPA